MAISATRILVVEDEPRISEVTMAYLAHAGFTADLIERGDQVMAAVNLAPPALMILDVMLPGIDGINLCRDIRKNYSFPIIMVTARAEEIDRLLGFDVGADDYLCKPFSPNELVARVRAWLRRSGATKPANHESIFTSDASAQRIYCHGQLLNLTPQEYRLLSVLMQAPSRVFSRAQLLELAYDNATDVFDRVIDSHIKNLRKRLKPALGDQEVIHSVYGVGYRFEFLN